MDDILNKLIVFLESGEPMKKVAIFLLFTVVPTIFTCSGFSIKDIFVFFRYNKNRRACKYVLLNRVYDENIESFTNKILILLFEMCVMIINMFAIIVIMELFLFFASIRNGVTNNNPYIIILLIAVIVIVMAFFGKNGKVGVLKQIKWVIFVLCEGILTILLITLLAQKEVTFLATLMIVSVLLVFSIVFTVHKCKMFDGYKDYVVKIFRTIRYIILLAETVLFYSNIVFIASNTNIIIWAMLCYLEYIWIVTHDGKSRVNITLHTKSGEKITRDKIMQYEQDKIGYKLLNGKEEIIDNNEVEKITYQIRNLIYKEDKVKRRIECRLRDDTSLEFQKYALINDTWGVFSKKEKGIKDVALIKIKDTESIIEERI